MPDRVVILCGPSQDFCSLMPCLQGIASVFCSPRLWFESGEPPNFESLNTPCVTIASPSVLEADELPSLYLWCLAHPRFPILVSREIDDEDTQRRFLKAGVAG